MCRLYGFHSNEATKVECTLIYAQNALMIQSRADLRGVSHADGWGIGFYVDSRPFIERRDKAAYQDLHFGSTAERVHSKTVVAHVRKATVGGLSTVNTHPFGYGSWIFAHNGTITAYNQIRERLERQTTPEFLAARKGSTDSELAFLWLLSRMRGGGVDPDDVCTDLGRLVHIFGQSIRTLAEWCREQQAPQDARLNFLLTDGRIVLASRWNNSLYWVSRQGVHDCEVCGIPHIQHQPEVNYQSVVLASEPISDESWLAIPERHLIAVDQAIHCRIMPV
ncbi:MAG: class II glutamine amidotransferase [Acidobacteriota bacterium]